MKLTKFVLFNNTLEQQRIMVNCVKKEVYLQGE
jgi:hypothetical protein